jgi:glutaredoxin
MSTLTLYTRPGCHLCEQARAIVERLRGPLGLALDEQNIDTDPGLAARYGTSIPVVALDGEEVLAWPFTAEGARRALTARLARD